MAMKFESAEFITSAASRKNWIPGNAPEVAIAGRSNVGKSSLINELTRRKKLAKISSTPGKTQLINFFRIDDGPVLVDLPGYGFARVPLAIKNKWRSLVEQYLRDREALRGVVVLIDSRRGAKEMDLNLLVWLAKADLPACLVLTKVDKLKKRERKIAADALVEDMMEGDGCYGHWSGPILTSAEKGWGRKELIVQMNEWLEKGI